MKNLARIGCLARSVVYFLVGLLAFLVAMGNRYGETTDTRGALRVILDRAYGPFLLVLLALGLFSYAVWRFFQSIQDHDRYGRTLHGRAVRTGFFFSGLAHAGLGVYALNLVFGFMRKTALGERMMAKWILMQPLGKYALEAAGAAVVITGLFQFLRAFDGSFTRDLRLPKKHMKSMMFISQFGLVARGIVFVIIGSFFFQSGWKSRSREAGGLVKAWEILHAQPFGNYLLGLVAAGFMAFAIFGLIEGFYRRI